MATRKQKRQQNRKSLFVVLGIVLVGLIVTGAVLVANKISSAGVADPNELTVTWKTAGGEVQVKPYRVCDLFEKDSCTTTEANAHHMKLGAQDTAELIVGSEVGSNAWTVQRFYADESVNSSTKKNPGEADRETIAGSAAVANERTALGVVEVSTAVVGKNAAGEETTYGITWSIVNDEAGHK